MKVPVKGQITLPISLREYFVVTPGTKVAFVSSGDVLLVKPRKKGGKTASASERRLFKATGAAEPEAREYPDSVR